MARVDSLTQDLVFLMKKAGCYGIGFGVESGNERILKNIKKGTTLQQCRNAYKYCKKAGLKTYATFMFGNPGEDRNSIEETINFAIELDPDIAIFYVLTPFPGSEVFDIYNGKLFNVSSNFDNYNIMITDAPHALCSYEFSQEELKKYISLANRRFYFRFTYLLRQFIRQKSWRQVRANIEGFLGMLKQTLLARRKASMVRS